MADSSFDIVSKLDRQEVDNAVNQTAKEIGQRFDFRGTGASITLSGEEIVMTANADERVLAILDVLQSKLIRRGLSLKSLDVGEPKQSGKEVRLVAGLKEGISTEAVDSHISWVNTVHKRSLSKRNTAGVEKTYGIGNHFNGWNDNAFNPAVETFMEEVCGQPDTYCTTHRDVIQWLSLQDPERVKEWQSAEASATGKDLEDITW